MRFNMISRFLLWFKRILAQIYQNREPPPKTPSQEKPSSDPQIKKTEPTEQSPQIETPTAITAPTSAKIVRLSDNKRISTDKEKAPEPNHEYKQIFKRSGEQSTETQKDLETVSEHEIIKQDVDKTQKLRKPYKRKTPTEGVRERRRISQKDKEKDKRASPRKEPRKEIDLGETQRKSQRMAKTSRKPAKKRHVRKKKEKVVLRRVASPFVELDLIEARIYLVLPEQEFNLEQDSEFPQKANYAVRLNPEGQKVSASVARHKDKTAHIKEKRIELKSPLKSFSISFPEELESRVYSYNHGDDKIYAFVATGNNRARMHYLYDKEGKFNPLPKRDVWILLKEDFLLTCEPDVIEEIWVWERYQPCRVNLSGINEIGIQNGHTTKEEKMACEASFWIDGGGLVEDDFSMQTPIYSEGSIKLNSLRQNPSGWIVWVQNKYAGHLIASKSWNGADLLELEIPNHLPCDCGEFQIDICEKSGGLPVDTLFFRYVPGIQLECSRDLLFPDPRQGHDPAVVRVLLNNTEENYHLSACNKIQILGDWHYVEMPPDNDIFRFLITKKVGPETVTTLQVTLPRLKWRVAENDDWADQLLKIKKNDLVSGRDRYLSINTNDLRTKYDILATLKQSGVKLQEERFIRKGTVYNAWLNKFHETIFKNKGDLTLITEVCEKGGQLLGEIDIIHFYEEATEKPEDTSEKAPEKIIKSLDKQIRKKKLEKPKAIRPTVRLRRRIRSGKGFSWREIMKAGIQVNDWRRLNITFDKRRKTAYLRNVETLKTLVGVKKNGD